MTAVFIALGILVGVVLAVLLPWALLRKLESNDQEEEELESNDRGEEDR